jgi:ribonuclease R
VGRRSGRQFRMGDKVTIKVIAANLVKRQLDYEWVISVGIKEKESLGISVKGKVKEQKPKKKKK